MTKTLWQDQYKAATLEANPAELSNRIDLATAAIHERIGELTRQQNESAMEELRAISDALNSLLVLRKLEGQRSADATSTAESAPQEKAS